MRVLHQADTGCDHVFGNCHGTGDVLVAGLGVVAVVRDRADDVDAACAGQIGGAAVGQGRVEVVGDAVILDHSAIGVGTAVQAGAVAVGRNVVAEQTGKDDAVGELAGRAEQHDLFPLGRRVPYLVGSGPLSDPWQPRGGQIPGFYFHARGLHLHGGDDAEADEVFKHAGKGGEIVHTADGGASRTRVQPA